MEAWLVGLPAMPWHSNSSVPLFRARGFRSWLVYPYFCLSMAMSHAAIESPCSSSSEINLQRVVVQQ